MSDNLDHSDLLAKWLKGDLSREDQQRLEESGNLDDLKVVLDDLDQWSLPKFNIDKGLAEVKRRRSEKKKAKAFAMPLKTLMGIAASLLLLLGVYFGTEWIGGDQYTLETALGEQVDHTLPDGSTVRLDALSSIAYKKDWENQRQLTLSGRAYFKVKKGQVFSVQTALGQVQVLGTAFEVTDAQERFDVRCFEGKVLVRTSGQSETLIKGERAFIKKGVLKRELIQSTEPDWSQGFSQFDKEPLPNVVDELRKYYAVNIELPDRLVGYQFSGRFPHSDLKLALRSIFDPLEVSYVLTDEGNVIFN